MKNRDVYSLIIEYRGKAKLISEQILDLERINNGNKKSISYIVLKNELEVIIQLIGKLEEIIKD